MFRRLILIIISILFFSSYAFSLDERAPRPIIIPPIKKELDKKIPKKPSEYTPKKPIKKVFKPKRYYTEFTFDELIEEKVFKNEITIRDIKKQDYYKVFYHKDKRIKHYELYLKGNKLYKIVHYHYNSRDNLKKILTFDSIGKPIELTLYSYDNKDRLDNIIEYLIIDKFELFYLKNEPDDLENYTKCIRKWVYYYDDFGNMIREDLVVKNEVHSFQLMYYNEDKQLMKREKYNPLGLSYSFLYFYRVDELVRKEMYCDNNKLVKTFHY